MFIFLHTKERLSVRGTFVDPRGTQVLSSSYVNLVEREAALAAAVREIVLKPSAVEELGAVLHNLLSDHRTAAIAS